MGDPTAIDYLIVANALLGRSTTKLLSPTGDIGLRVAGAGYSTRELRSIVSLVYGEGHEISETRVYNYGTDESITMIDIVESQEDETSPRAND